MKLLSRALSFLLVLVLLVGCAAETVTSDRQEYKGERIARPDHIIVYNFAAPRNLPNAQIATARQVGATIANDLVAEISAMGLTAVLGSNQTAPRIGDVVIKGYLLSVEEGDAAKRVALGFGSGAAELKVMVEGYLMTNRGLKKLGSGTSDSGGSKSPGAAQGVVGAIATANPAGLIISSGMKVYGETSGSSTIEGRAADTAKEIASALRVKFQQQGWI